MVGTAAFYSVAAATVVNRPRGWPQLMSLREIPPEVEALGEGIQQQLRGRLPFRWTTLPVAVADPHVVKELGRGPVPQQRLRGVHRVTAGTGAETY